MKDLFRKALDVCLASYIRILYRLYLHRAPDTQGFIHYRRSITKPHHLLNITLAIARSNERRMRVLSQRLYRHQAPKQPAPESIGATGFEENLGMNSAATHQPPP